MTKHDSQQQPQQATIDRPPFSDPDFVDRVFEYLLTEFPQIAGPQFAQAQQAMREEFCGERMYVRGRSDRDRQALVASVLALFNGRNATEIARHLGIGRTTVYRILKQASAEQRR